MSNKERWRLVRQGKRATWYVSDLGRCKSVITTKRHGTQTRITEGYYNPYIGYRTFGGEYVHRLVAMAYLPNPLNLEQVDHINGDRTDNRLSNLRWASRQDNNTTERANQLRSQNYRQTRHANELIEATKDGEVKYYDSGMSAARDLGCSHVLVYNTLNNRSSARRARGWSLRWVAISELAKR